jgi:tRNA(fMet)-specific endonuclease VapC
MPSLPSGLSAMPGKRYLLDTNALVALLQGNAELLALTRSAEWLGVSVINVLEFTGFDGLNDQDRSLFEKLVSRVTVVDLAYSNSALMGHIAALRQRKTLKLPDAIVAATAALHQATVLTNDAQMIKLAAADSAYSARSFSP